MPIESSENDSKLKTREEIQRAEAKIAEGIQSVHDFCQKNLSPSYDVQGIAVLELTKEQLDANQLSEYFPNKAKNGLTVILYKEGFVKHPPLAFMLQQKINSLCQAASLYLSAEDAYQVKQQFLAGISQEMKKLQNVTDANQFHEKAQEIMKSYTAKTLIQLYDKVHLPDKEKVKFATFSRKIIANSSHHRSSDANILTFDEAAKTFSYDEPITTVTAHDRGLDTACANLSMVFEGKYNQDDQPAEITSYIFKHASLPPIDKIKGIRLGDSNESDLDILIETCNHIEDIATGMVALRQHGGAQGPITIDWNYQLLTTNALNTDKQTTSYGYAVRAANLMNGAYMDVLGGTPTTINVNVFNAGINSIANYNLGYKTDTQRRENRKAYLEMSEAARMHVGPLIAKNNLGVQFSLDVSILKQFYDYNKIPDDLEAEYQKIKSQISLNSSSFNLARKAYSELKKRVEHNPDENSTLSSELKTQKDLIEHYMYKSEQFNDQLRRVTYKIEKVQKEVWKNYSSQIQLSIKNLLSPESTKLILNDLNSNNETVKNQAADRLIALTALTYKSYMDELYYSGQYREPKAAALFNGYLAAYQQITGFMASTGCKSANDRTWIARLIIAGMEGRDSTFPNPVHRDAVAFSELTNKISTMAISNSAIISTIMDTAGGTPKVDAKKFTYLEEVKGINFIGKFGKYAAHKLKGLVVSFDNMYKKSLSTYRNLFQTLGVDKSSIQHAKKHDYKDKPVNLEKGASKKDVSINVNEEVETAPSFRRTIK